MYFTSSMKLFFYQFYFKFLPQYYDQQAGTNYTQNHLYSYKSKTFTKSGKDIEKPS